MFQNRQLVLRLVNVVVLFNGRMKAQYLLLPIH
jgi:hypothetical protein